jgi:16S rRNA (guanine527-N7)-methyltransferase
LPAPPELAETLFGDRLSLAVRYAERLAGDGVDWGLIGPRESGRLWERHLLNCVAVAALVPPGSLVVDVGSGAGLPGIVLAIARPDLRIALVEPMLRRAAFLQSVVTDLQLGGVEIFHARAEEVVKGGPAADVVTARAVAKVERLAALAAPLLRPGGELLAIKGSAVYDEMADGWHGVQRAHMTRGAALFSIRPCNGASGAVHQPVWQLAGVGVTCDATWDDTGTMAGSVTGHATTAENATTAELRSTEALALVVRLVRN